MKDLELKRYSLFLYFVIAYALPIVITVTVALLAGLPADIVVKDLPAAALVIVMAMVHAPTIAAMKLVYRSDDLKSTKILFQRFKTRNSRSNRISKPF